jgi:hypothetical protein
MNGLTHDDVEHLPKTKEAEVLIEEEEFKGEQSEYPEYSVDDDACPICEITLHTLCKVCNVKVPLGDTRKGMLKHEFQNRHHCNCDSLKSQKKARTTYGTWNVSLTQLSCEREAS